MAQIYLWMIALVAIFDIAMLVLNFGKLRYKTKFSPVRLIIGVVLAIVLITGIFRPSAVDLTDKMMLAVFALTALTWGLIRKGIGEKYVLISLGTAGLQDWRNFKDVTVESKTETSVTVSFTNFLKRTRTLTLIGKPSEIQPVIKTKMAIKK